MLFRCAAPLAAVTSVRSDRVARSEATAPNRKAGRLPREIGMFSPDRARTATAICATDGELLALTEDQVRQSCISRTRGSASIRRR